MIASRKTPTCAMLFGIAIFVTPMSMAAPLAPQANTPSRAPEKGCKWEKFSDATVGLDAWVQRCDFGKRKIDFVGVGRTLAQRYSDSQGAPEMAVAVLDLLPAESPEHGLQRLFAARTDRKLVAQCVLTPYRGNGLGGATPVGVRRYTFEPNAALKKALKAKADPNDVPAPPCGAWGADPDGIQYFEAQPASGVQKVLFVRVGQDTPLFDEATLRVR